ncbi:hypothetical protein N3K66_002587 [Trichothecium roseum]|uniref:Uncharacterized protein n=1 Tax=Trichothecium roseum TaxID=47278 RepID=A0ACC0V9Z7_9HYPO|nr:hypothetical protein N3K66_002587 [Trichothecium roseum]
MTILSFPKGSSWAIVAICLFLFAGRAHAFGAGNIPSVAQVEGHNWRHGDIEDMLATISFLYGKKWTSRLIKLCYWGNWLRDYSQAVDVGTLKGVNSETLRILVWVLSFMAFGYATEEFEVTSERLGVYRPEEHIDNPRGYADGTDARKFDKRLRGPVNDEELDIDPRTGMKNYIANESGRWATSAGYLRFSFARSIHFGRLYTSSSNGKGKDEDLHEALRCLGQALHCMEDFSAHSNYCELALRELGYHNVFPHTGVHTETNIHGKRIFPLTTGTFGAVDFLHSVIGEATDHISQSEVDEVDIVLKNAEGVSSSGKKSGGERSRSLFGSGGPSDFISTLSKLPVVGGGLASDAQRLKSQSDQQEKENKARASSDTNPNLVPGMSPSFDPVKTAGQIYPILVFRDKIVKTISRGIAKVPGLEKLLDHISETLTAFILGLLAPFIRPIIQQVSKVLKDGSSSVITASAKTQYEPWDNPRCTDPSHSMLAKDHFTNLLNSAAGRVAATVLQYTVPRILYAWEHPNVPVDEVVNDVLRAFHHPALRNENVEIQRTMFQTMKKWADEHPKRHQLDSALSSDSVKKGKNHVLNQAQHSESRGGGHGHDHGDPLTSLGQFGHGKLKDSLWSQVRTRDMDAMTGRDDAPPAGHSPVPPPSFSYGQNPSYGGGYDAPPPQHHGGGYNQPPPPHHGYGQPPPHHGYGQPPPPPGPPPGHYGHPPHGPPGGAAADYYGGQPPPPSGGYPGNYRY